MVPFATSDDGSSRTNSTASIFQNVSSKSRSNTGLCLVETASEPQDAVKSSKSRPKASTFSGFFKGLGSRSISKHHPTKTATKAQLMKSLDINEAAIERIMGKPKDVTQTFEDVALRQRVYEHTGYETGSVDSIDECESKNGRGRAKHVSNEETQCIFAGAPYFNAGKTRSQVVFVDESSKAYIPATTDCRPLEHATFGICTLVPGKVDQLNPPLLGDSRAALLEVPSMQSFHGAEPGTMGFQHYLQVAMAEPPVLRNRKPVALDPGQVGIRDPNTDANIDQLAELGDLRQMQQEDTVEPSRTNEQQVAELSDHLFTTLLHPPSSTETRQAGLRVQIEALQGVLKVPHVWHDFSLPDVRLRIGQLLWSAPIIPRRPSYGERYLEPSDREIILLQITLASELLVRLALVHRLCSTREGSSHIFSETDRIAVENSRSTKVNWDLVLAERFLDNIDLSARIPNKTIRNGLFSRISYLASKEGPEPFYQPKDAARQISGLAKFAEMLNWPTAAVVEEDLMAKLVHPEEQQQPKASESTPHEAQALRRKPSGFTGDLEYSSGNFKAQQFLGISRRASRPNTAKIESRETNELETLDTIQAMQLQPRVNANTCGSEADIGGWLSRSWLSGLVLPGDSTCHFLMSALLENTPNAIDAVGDIANLHAGFVFKGRSYWSKHCVVGRVMAAAEGAAECMGWVSVPVTGQREGWAQLDIQDALIRSKEPEAVGKASNPLGRRERTALLETDFTLPRDGLPVVGNEARSHGLVLKESKASITFSSPVNSKLASLRVELKYNVHFVSAHPCFPPEQEPSTESKAEEEKNDEDEEHSDFLIADPSPPAPCHPLHIDYKFDTLPVASLLSSPPEHDADSANSPNKPIDPILILDCRGSPDLQLLARTRCAQVGENAIVSRVGRTCIACSVREAYALSISVVIRI